MAAETHLPSLREEPLVAALVDLDGIFVGGHSWLRVSIRLPRWYALRVARKRRVIA